MDKPDLPLWFKVLIVCAMLCELGFGIALGWVTYALLAG